MKPLNFTGERGEPFSFLANPGALFYRGKALAQFGRQWLRRDLARQEKRSTQGPSHPLFTRRQRRRHVKSQIRQPIALLERAERFGIAKEVLDAPGTRRRPIELQITLVTARQRQAHGLWMLRRLRRGDVPSNLLP